MNVLRLRGTHENRSSRCPAAQLVILCSGFMWNSHVHPQKAEIIISRESLANVVRSMVYFDIGTDPDFIGGPRTFQCGGRVRRFYLRWSPTKVRGGGSGIVFWAPFLPPASFSTAVLCSG